MSKPLNESKEHFSRSGDWKNFFYEERDGTVKLKRSIIIFGTVGIFFIGLTLFARYMNSSDKEDQFNSFLSSKYEPEYDTDFSSGLNGNLDKGVMNGTKKFHESILSQEQQRLEEQRKAEEKVKALQDSIDALNRKKNEAQKKISSKRKERPKKRHKQNVAKKKPSSAPKKILYDEDGIPINVTDETDKKETTLVTSFGTTNKNPIEKQHNTGGSTLYFKSLYLKSSNVVRSGSVVLFENREPFIFGDITIPSYSKFETMASLSSNQCRFRLQRVHSVDGPVFDVSGQIYDANRNPFIAIKSSGGKEILKKASNTISSLASSYSSVAPILVQDNINTASDMNTTLKDNLKVLVTLTLRRR